MGSYIVIIGIVVVGFLMGLAMSFALKFASKGQINPTVNFKRPDDMMDEDPDRRRD